MEIVELQGAAAESMDPIAGPQKVFFRRLKTKPRGLEEAEEEAEAALGSNPREEVAIADAVWGNLPDELVDRILAWLPPICLFRLRGVCRRWHSLVNEPGFLKLVSQLPSHGPCFLLTQKKKQSGAVAGETREAEAEAVWQSAVYSYPMKAWHSLPLSFLPGKAHSVIASAGGLLCLVGLEGRHDELFVCNPLRREWKRLPDMHFTRQIGFVSMLVDSRSQRRFQIVAAGDCSYSGNSSTTTAMPTEVYDSGSGVWSVCESLPAGRNLHSSLKSAFCNGRLYCLTLSPCSLVSFDLGRGAWELVPVKMPRSLLDAFLVAGPSSGSSSGSGSGSNSDCLLLVGRVGLYSVHQSMQIWRLDLRLMEWVEIGRMPHALLRALLRSSADSFQCFGHGKFIAFSALKQQHRRWLLYDASKQLWHWLGECPTPLLSSGSSSSSCRRIRGFFFEPRLDMTLVSLPG